MNGYAGKEVVEEVVEAFGSFLFPNERESKLVYQRMKMRKNALEV